MISSHRLLRYASPFLHLLALGDERRAARRGRRLPRRRSPRSSALLARRGGAARARPFLVARYYVLMTASVAAGLVDWLRTAPRRAGTPPEGTR